MYCAAVVPRDSVCFSVFYICQEFTVLSFCVLWVVLMLVQEWIYSNSSFWSLTLTVECHQYPPNTEVHMQISPGITMESQDCGITWEGSSYRRSHILFAGWLILPWCRGELGQMKHGTNEALGISQSPLKPKMRNCIITQRMQHLQDNAISRDYVKLPPS